LQDTLLAADDRLRGGILVSAFLQLGEGSEETANAARTPRSLPPSWSVTMSYNAQLVKVAPAPQVYLVVNGQTCWVENPTVYVFLFGDDWTQIQEITQVELDSMYAGPSIPSNAYVATTTGSYPYWLVLSSQAYPFASEAVFNTYPFESTNIKTISSAVFEGLTLDFTITE
jgi:hypothetical protein